MKKDEMYEYLEKVVIPECLELCKTKGLSYSGLEDSLDNFKRGAKLTGIVPEKVWFVYFTKHFDALSSYIRNEYNDSESIKGRIYDLINYLWLLLALLKEQEKI